MGTASFNNDGSSAPKTAGTDRSNCHENHEEDAAPNSAEHYAGKRGPPEGKRKRNPVLLPRVDLTPFRFDPLTERIVDLIRQKVTLDGILDTFSDRATEVGERLAMLERFNIIQWSDASPPEEPRGASRAPSASLETSERRSQMPEMICDVDLSCYQFDPLTQEVLDLIRRRGIIGEELFEAFEGRDNEVAQTLDNLERFHLIRWVSADLLHREGETGSLTDKSVDALVDEAESSMFTGRLGLERDGDTVSFYFIEGSPRGVKSSIPRHDHGAMLRDAGLIDRKVYARYQSGLQRHLDPIESLRFAGINTRNAMAKLVVWRGQAIFKEVRKWDWGTYRIVKNAPFPLDIARCRLRLAVRDIGAWREGHLTPDQEAFLNRHEGRYLVGNEQTVSVIESMGFDDAELRFAKAIAESAPIVVHRAPILSPFFKSKAKKIIFFLIRNGAFDMLETNPDGNAPIPTSEIESVSEFLSIRNYFEVLGVHAVSIDEDIQQRYEEQMDKFHAKWYAHATPPQKECLRRIRARVEEARRVLSDPTSRREYRAKIYTPFQIDNFFDLQMEKAGAAMNLRCNPREALPSAISALDLKPNSLEAKKMVRTLLNAVGRGREASRYGC